VKKVIISLVICLLMLGLISAPVLADTPVARHKVIGGGTIERPVVGVELGLVTAAFIAQQVDESGNAEGELVIKLRNPMGDMRVKADIVCLAVDGNKAWIVGVVVEPSSTWFIGFEVQDNGEGSEAIAPDLISQAQRVDGPTWALGKPDLAMVGWTNGNVQVK